MKAADPAGLLDGERVAMTGVGRGVADGAMVKGEDTEDKEGIVVLDTVIVDGPGKAVSVAEIAAVS